MAIARGRCSSEPMSEVNSVGTMANMVVSEVIMIGRSRRSPAVCMASRSGVPA